MSFLKKYRNKPENLFKTLFWNFLFGYFPFSIFMGVLSLFEIVPVKLNGEPTYGIKAFIVLIIFTPVVALILAGMSWIYFSIGNFFLRLLIKE